MLGHFIEKGYCEGSVLSFEDCEAIEIDESVMYGSGTYGIQAFRCKGITVTNSVIKDCSYGTIYMSDVSNVEFRDTHFKRCQASVNIRGNSKLILFTDCYFTGIKDYQDWSKWNKDAQFIFNFEPTVESILLKNNRFDRNSTTGFISNEEEVTVKGSSGSGNTFALE